MLEKLSVSPLYIGCNITTYKGSFTTSQASVQAPLAIVRSENDNEGARTDLALVVTDERAAVVLDDGRQLRSRELTVGHPARELVVPNAVVTTKELAVCLSEVCDLVAAGERELTLGGLSSIL